MNNEQIILIVILIFSIIIHEVSHGLAAYFQGDKTAERAGRLTLNPIPHIDLLGTIFLPGLLLLSGSNFLLGWAKPVPYNPNNLRNKRWGELIVAIAGPVSNFILMFIFIFSAWILDYFVLGSEFIFRILFLSGFLNLFLGIFNLFPIPPLDGSKILYSILPISLGNKIRVLIEKFNLFLFFAFVLILINTDFLTSWIPIFYEKILRLFS